MHQQTWCLNTVLKDELELAKPRKVGGKDAQMGRGVPRGGGEAGVADGSGRGAPLQEITALGPEDARAPGRAAPEESRSCLLGPVLPPWPGPARPGHLAIAIAAWDILEHPRHVVSVQKSLRLGFSNALSSQSKHFFRFIFASSLSIPLAISLTPICGPKRKTRALLKISEGWWPFVNGSHPGHRD